MANWRVWMHGYTTAMKAADRSPNTIRLHCHYLARLARRHPDPSTVTTDDLRTFLADHDWKPETRKSARGVIRSFYRWSFGIGLITDNPALMLDPIRVPRAMARPAPESVVASVCASAERPIQLMAMLAAYAGLRCIEIAQVHETHLLGDVLRVVGKGRKVREVPVVHPGLLSRLEAVRGWAFPGRIDGHLSPGHVSRLVSRALPDGWTAHTLRHRMATTAYAGTRDLLAVGAVLGHSRPETTQRYVRLPDDALRAAVTAAA